MTRRSPKEKTIAQRMASIHISQKDKDGIGRRAAQLLKADEHEQVWLAGRILVAPYPFAQTLQMRILQANSSTTVANLILTSLGLFIAGYAIAWLFAPMVLIDVRSRGSPGLAAVRDSFLQA